MSHHPHEGDRVAHRSLDDPELGTALDGRVVSVIGEDDPSQLVVVQMPDGSKVAYVHAELQRLHGIPVLNRGPVILHLRHLRGLLLRPFRRSSNN